LKRDNSVEDFFAVLQGKKDTQQQELATAVSTLVGLSRQVYLQAIKEGFTEKVAAQMAIELVVEVFKGGISQ
jgi:hypothetical protein